MKQARRPIGSFLTVLSLAGFSTGLARVTTSLYAVTLHATPGQVGALAACQSLGLVLMSLPSGALVHRHGPVAVFLGGGLVGALACAAVPIVHAPWFLIACVIGVGVCMPLRFVATNVVTMELIEEAGQARAGWYRAVHLLSMFLLGPAVAVPVVAAVGFPVTWWLVAATFLLPSLLAPGALAPAAPGAARPSTRGGLAPALRAAVSLPETRLLAASEFAAQGTFTCFSFFILPVAMERHAFSASAASALLGAQAATFILTLFLLGGVATRWSRRRFVLVAFGAALAGLLLLGTARGGGALWTGSLLLGAGLGLIQLDNLLRASALGARVGQETASGLQSLSGSSGGLLGGLAGGLAGGALGTQSVFLLLAPLFALLAWRELTGAALSRRARAGRGTRGSAPSRSPASASSPEACEG